jgi:DNA polymerase III epsilon subunit-like protein
MTNPDPRDEPCAAALRHGPICGAARLEARICPCCGGAGGDPRRVQDRDDSVDSVSVDGWRGLERASMRTVYFDVETGGLRPEHPLIQIAAVAIDDATWQELDAIEMKLRFDSARADPEALRMNHYDAALWRALALSSGQAITRFTRFLEPHRTLSRVSQRTGRPYRVAQLAGHHAASFDAPRLQQFFRDAGAFLPADLRVLDTLQRALWWFQEHGLPPHDYKLGTLCQYFSIPVREGQAHDALADVRLTVQLARRMSQPSPGDRCARGGPQQDAPARGLSTQKTATKIQNPARRIVLPSSPGMDGMTAATRHKGNQTMTTMHPDHRHRLPAQPTGREAQPPLACLYCAATQATVRRPRQILEACLGDQPPCVCCDCETANACPHCLSVNLEYGSYDFGSDPQTGYYDSGERYYCRACGASGDADDTAAVLVMLPQPTQAEDESCWPTAS